MINVSVGIILPLSLWKVMSIVFHLKGLGGVHYWLSILQIGQIFSVAFLHS